LALAIEAAGGEPLLYPTIEITDTDNPRAAKQILISLGDFNWAIFISANAVEKTFARLTPSAWPPDLPVAAIGAATAEALRTHGVKKILAPKDTFDSEALLALPEFHAVKNSRVVIFRGQSGRETLKQTLTERGAEVIYCECYRRIKPTASNSLLLQWLKQKKIRAIDVMSGESLANLLEMAGDAATLLKPLPLITHHPRVAHLAEAGFTHIITCAANDSALMTVLESLTLGKL
jgi:uroporphyrinogen-III synthase